MSAHVLLNLLNDMVLNMACMGAHVLLNLLNDMVLHMA